MNQLSCNEIKEIQTKEIGIGRLTGIHAFFISDADGGAQEDGLAVSRGFSKKLKETRRQAGYLLAMNFGEPEHLALP